MGENMKFTQTRSDAKDRGAFHGKKFGIIGKRHSSGSFGFYYHNDDYGDSLISEIVRDGKGIKLLELSRLTAEYVGSSGIEEMDFIEKSINGIVRFILDYFSELKEQKDFNNTDKSTIRHLYYILQSALAKQGIQVGFDLKSSKTCRETACSMSDAIDKFIVSFKYDNINTISEHLIAPCFDFNSPLYDSELYIGADHYFNGALDLISDKYQQKLKDTKRLGKTFLVSLALGDTSINDFNAREDF
jgi:hypothetical protein